MVGSNPTGLGSNPSRRAIGEVNRKILGFPVTFVNLKLFIVMENKVCNKCGGEFSIDEFPIKNKNKGTHYPWCHNCHKEYRREYYQKNKAKISEQDNLTSTERKNRNRQFVWDYYKANPCIDCGENNPLVLEFDHKDDSDKIDRISKMVSGKWSIERIKEEITKCDVRCANCHHIRTAEQQGWYKDIIK